MTTTKNRTAGAAGQMRAGEPFADPDSTVAALVAGVASTADCDAARPILERRHEAALAAFEAHGEPDELAEDAELESHAAERERLRREVDRTRAGLERLASRRVELDHQERHAVARKLLADAAKAADRAEAIASKVYPDAAAKVGALLAELADLERTVVAARAAAQDVGLGAEAEALRLPHESRFQREIVEEREVRTRNRAPGTYDVAGNRLDGKPAEWVEERRTERVVVQPRHAPRAITRARAVLPSPDGGNLLDRGED